MARNYPVGKAQQQVLDALGLTATGGRDVRYNLNTQAGRANFDADVEGSVVDAFRTLETEEALGLNPRELAAEYLRVFVDEVNDGAVKVDNLDEAKARFLSAFAGGARRWQIDHITDQLNDELWGKVTGYTTAVEVAPRTELANPAVVEVVVLDNDGDTVVYRYSDDSIDYDWELGVVEDVAEEWASMREIQFERQEAFEQLDAEAADLVDDEDLTGM